MDVRFTRFAAVQVRETLAESSIRHGATAASRYRALIDAALQALANEPSLASRAPAALGAGVLLYPLRLARRRLPEASRVRRPPHVLVLRVIENGAVLPILGLAHERMLLNPAAKRLLERAEDD